MSGGFIFSLVAELLSQQGIFQLGRVAHAYNASPWEAEARRLPSSVPAASTADACKGPGRPPPPPPLHRTVTESPAHSWGSRDLRVRKES